MKNRPLIVLAILLANSALILLLSVLAQRSDELENLRGRLEAETLRQKAAQQLADQAISSLERSSPAEARALEVRAALVRSGDVRLLDPKAHPELHKIFDDML